MSDPDAVDDYSADGSGGASEPFVVDKSNNKSGKFNFCLASCSKPTWLSICATQLLQQ